MRRFLTLSTSSLLLLGLGSGWLAFYPATPSDLAGAANLDAVATRVKIPVTDEDRPNGIDSLDGWLLPGSGRGVLLMFHGYGRMHDRMWRYAGFLRPAGYTLLAIDFRSSRARDRRPTTLGYYELQDARATLAWARRQPWAKHQPIGVFGESLGGSVALLLAAERPEVKAVVADCPFASGRRAMEDSFERWAHVPRWPAVPIACAIARAVTGHDPGDADVVSAAQRLRDRPLFIVHTAHDDRMGPGQARRVWRAAGAKDVVWFVEDAGHNEGWLKHRQEYERRVLEFFDVHLRRDARLASSADASP